ncbi:MAG: hypothetical protein V4510_12740 [bacterium]
MTDAEFLETRRYEWSAKDFIEDPELFVFIRDCWEGQKWAALFGGNPPVGAVMAELPAEGGIRFWFKAQPPA